jgi:MSHA biogenesis protein MshE
MLLVTGPTGSGKTTTLYATLARINKPDSKIITVEDPVEYRLPRINQVQINPKIGLDFARVLRSALRQDPDIIMVGEMRDRETAEIGLRAAMTGHLVLSTLHTNDAISTVTRLIDMGAHGYMIAAALHAVIAQRLVRRICEYCGEDSVPTDQERAWLASVLGDEAAAGFKTRHGHGCAYCNATGYRGRIGVYELLEVDGPLSDALRRENTEEFIELARAQHGFRSFILHALEFARGGVTTVAEALGLAGGVEEIID